MQSIISEISRLSNILTKINNYFEHLLYRDKYADVLQYLTCERQLSLDTIKAFKLGFIPDIASIIEFCKLNNIDKRDLHNIGISKLNSGGELLNLYCNRVSIPKLNLLGNIVGYSTRQIPARLSYGGKYKDSRNTALIQKRNYLFNLNNAVSCNYIILVEGMLDVVSGYQAGIPNIVGCSGTAFTMQQVSLLRLFTKNILVGFDSDNAGKKALLNLQAIDKHKSLIISVLNYGDCKDLDSYYKTYGSDRLKQLIDNALYNSK